MKRITTLWSFFLTLLVAVSMSTAQEDITSGKREMGAASSLRADTPLSGFGYADRFVQNGYYGIGTTDYYVSCYIRLPNVGANKITKISFPAKKAEEDAYILILTEDGKSTLYSQACEIVEGNNEITLSTPFATEAGKHYLVGFSVKPSADQGNDSRVLPFDYVVDVDDALYAAFGTKPYPTKNSTDGSFDFIGIKGQGFGAACIFVSLEDESMVHNMAFAVNVSGEFDPVKKGESVLTKVTLRNIGLNAITTFDLSYQFGSGEKKTSPHTLASSLEPGKTDEYSFDIATPDEGIGTVFFTISKVNGKVNPLANYHKDLLFRIDDPNAGIKRETVLIEHFTGENYGSCPSACATVNEAIKSFKEAGFRVSHVMYHWNDAFMLEETKDNYSFFFMAPTSVYAPAIAINRTYIPSESMLCISPLSADFVASTWINELNDNRQGVKIDKVDQTITGDKLEVIIAGKVFRGAYDPENLYLTVILTEDNVTAKKQNGAGFDYKHMALARLFLTNAFGDKVTPNADGTFSVTLECTLKPDWDKKQCKVVAIAHANLKSDVPHRRGVYTAETAFLGSDLANEQVVPSKAPIVSTENGYLSILGHVDSFKLYNLSGTLVTTSIETQLDRGVYVIRIFSNQQVYTSKVIVR